jgi:hypothetical protein
LTTGPEPEDARNRYATDRAAAGEHLAGIMGQADLSPGTRAAVATITQRFPVYSGYVEAARANDRLELTVGAAWLGRASDVMTGELLPAALALYTDAAHQLDRGYRDGTARADVVVLVGVTAIVVALLALVQLFVSIRVRRLINVGLAITTLVVAGVATLLVVVLGDQQHALSRSEREGSTPLVLLASARILALRSLSDENLYLIERGTSRALLDDFDAVTASIGGDGGLLDRATAAAADPAQAQRITEIDRRFEEYLAVHARVRALDDAGEYGQAVDVAVDEQVAAAVALDESMAAELEAARTSLEANATRAGRRMRWAPVLTLAAVAAAIASAVAGLQVRMREYR